MQLSISSILLIAGPALLIGCAAGAAYYAIRSRRSCRSAAEQTEQLNQMFVSLRGQRHDFLNHIQTLRSLIKMKRYDALETYLDQFAAETERVHAVIRIGHPMIAALIHAKLTEAERRSIDFEFDFVPMEQLNLNHIWPDIVKILGNLIDNAFDEVEKLPPEERVAECTGYVSERKLILTVSNPCADPVARDRLDMMFKPGFTTKYGGSNEGLGLAIALQRARAHRGDIEASYSEEEGMVMRVILPLH
jgi:sensor histidine kinase regulating citrate/malate metabolism